MPLMEILTVEEMGEADRLTIAAGTSGFALMLHAGRAVADVAQALAPEGRILVVAGCGNNGGDGFAAAAELAKRGHEVAVMLLCSRDTLKGDAALAARDWRGEVLACDPAALDGSALIIDALFGAGLDRPPQGDPHDMIVAMNESGIPILSVDLPSGVNGTTGEVMGIAVLATGTVTFFRRKPGHLLLPGRLHCGELEVADIGIGAQVLDAIKPNAFENDPELWRASFPVLSIDGHKYARGHAVVVSGPHTSTGAARLAARAALRAGAGLVTMSEYRGAVVRVVDPQMAYNVFDMRALLEPTAVARTVENGADVEGARAALRRAESAETEAERSLANRDFHRDLYAGCGNDILVATLDGLREQTALITVNAWTKRPSWEAEATEHEQILEAVAAGDPVAASARVLNHIRSFETLAIRQLHGVK